MCRNVSRTFVDFWLTTPRLGLRRFTPADRDWLVALYADVNVTRYLGGVLSVAAMSLGTAITVSLLATLAVTAKSAAVRLSGRGSTASVWIGNAIEILGAVLVIVIGTLLLGASLQG